MPDFAETATVSGKFDGVLPLTLTDYDRFRILDASLSRFAEDLRKCWVITPDKDFRELAAKINRPPYLVVRESEIVPEFRFFRHVGGWYKQQLIKIAIADWVESEFYLTLDADLICTKTLRYSDLVQENRGECFINPADFHPQWYEWAERVLKLRRSGRSHNVTPTVLSRSAVRKMQDHLSGLSANAKFKIGRTYALLCASRLGQRRLPRAPFLHGIRPWAVYLLVNLPWTEYSLYYTFLEAISEFDKYHFCAAHRLYSENSVWLKEHIESWDPQRSFARDDHSFFLVVQSNTGLDPQVIWEKIRPLIDESSVQKEPEGLR